jgi:DNA repair protein RecN (Recombination protein N)
MAAVILRRLHISGFVLFDDLCVEFGEGLNVLSGGSGEGKTLVLEALRFVLGEGANGRRSAQRWVRGEAPAEVQATFGVDSSLDTLTLERSLTRSGRGRCTIDAKAVPLKVLRSAGARLVECFGQGHATALLEPEAQRAALDRAAGTLEAAEGFRDARSDLLDCAQEHDRLALEEQRLRDRWEDVARERADLDALDPQPEEYEAIHTQLAQLEARAAHSATLHEVSAVLQNELQDRVHSTAAQIEGLVEAWPQLAEAADRLAEAAEQVQTAAYRVAAVQTEEAFEPRELDELRQRERCFRELGRRLRVAPAELARRWRELKDSDPDVLAHRRGQLAREVERGRKALRRRGRGLHRRRVQAAAQLSVAMVSELRRLGLAEARFVVTVEPTSEAEQSGHSGSESPAEASPGGRLAGLAGEFPHPSGLDVVAFRFSGNGTLSETLSENLAEVGLPGPLEHASGGELGRVALALGLHGGGRAGGGEGTLKGGSAEGGILGNEGPGLLVFDEIDQNVGARLGAAVGRCLLGISGQRQVLAITHLAPVAARAASHLRVRREEGRSTVELLAYQERVTELALMIKGEPVTAAARAQARELLKEVAGEALVNNVGETSQGTPRETPPKARRKRPRRKRARAS